MRPACSSATNLHTNRGGSTTVVHTVVWQNSVVWWSRGNTALWLVETV